MSTEMPNFESGTGSDLLKRKGGIPSVMQTDNECNTDAKQAMRRIEMQNNVMLCDIQFQDRNPL